MTRNSLISTENLNKTNVAATARESGSGFLFVIL